MIAEIMKTE